ncbi:MAG: hypothetical protein BGN86_15265 [Caulobacterales bacterium 68-7]|nr:exopolysaccharide biosynthesis protein [Caulobacterales bacterium]OJU11175.1 MAG: hypothetical protein BGN86_15265 [Caulobacterales bacterium 68-7]
MSSTETPASGRTLSAVLREICDWPHDHITVGEIVDLFGRRAFGALLFAFAIPNLLPLPPGSTTILGMPLVLLSPQVLIGINAPWLPRKLDDRRLRRSDLRKGLPRVIKVVEGIEKVSRARWGFMFGAVGDRMIGLVCTLLALALILPIPLGNLVPAIAVGLLGLGLFQRDGALVLFGHAVAAVGLGLIGLGGSAFLMALRSLWMTYGL